MAKLSEFEQGVFYAAGIVASVHGDPVIAATIIQNAGYGNHDVSSLDPADRAALSEINKEAGVKLTGLNK